MGKLLQKILSNKWLNLLAALVTATLIPIAGCSSSSLSRAPGGPAAVSATTQTADAQLAPAPGSAAADQDINKPVQKNIAVVKVFYATDRSRTSQSAPGRIFGSNRGTLSYGSCEVSIPRDPRLAKPEEPALARLEFKEQADNQPALRKVSPREYGPYLKSLKAAIARSPKKSAFVYVHGYNVTFADAARRTAQLKYDLGFDGAPIFFSWPSKGRSAAYSADEADVEWSQPDLKEFLKDLAAKANVRNIYLIAHSMGNRALTKAYIYMISERPELKKVFREVILIAPDIDSDVFKRDIAPALAASSNRTTLYSSSRDGALIASNKFQNYPRAGDSGPNLFLFEGIETVDATNVSTALLQHAHLADNSSVIADIYYLIRDGKKPNERSGLRTVNASAGQYWRFKRP